MPIGSRIGAGWLVAGVVFTSGCGPSRPQIAARPSSRSGPLAAARVDEDRPAIPPELWPSDAPRRFGEPIARPGRPAFDSDAEDGDSEPFRLDPPGPAMAGSSANPTTPARAPAGPTSPAPPPPTLAAWARELVEAHNAERRDRSLGPLAPEARLMAAAEAHALDMARRGTMSHTGEDGSQPHERIVRAGYPSIRTGENVAAGQRSVEWVVRDWMNSPSHRRNVLGDFREIGVGVARDRKGSIYWCVCFGR